MRRPVRHSGREGGDTTCPSDTAHVFTLANIARLYLGEAVETDAGSAAILKEKSADGRYVTVAVQRRDHCGDRDAGNWSLKPGRYVGVTERGSDDFVFAERLEELNEELEVLNAGTWELEEIIANNVSALLEVSA